ncbi:MAG: hypothetical protein LBL34_00750 [Clostridiales bacterium]|jgi:hypothetical protein|nr:hypothetical protein [Clostridiales bacterium]
MNNPLPIEYLHKKRAERYEATKHLSDEEFLKLAREDGRRRSEYVAARRRGKVGI